jgi:hypothetical protein
MVVDEIALCLNEICRILLKLIINHCVSNEKLQMNDCESVVKYTDILMLKC